MKFIVNKGSETFDKLTTLWNRIHEVDSASNALAEKHGWERYRRYARYLAGGINGVCFDHKPENWKQVEYGVYFPKRNKANKPLLDEIEALPIIKNDELNDILGFKWQFIGLMTINRPGVVFGKDFHLVEINEKAKYEPLPDMEEITVSKFQEYADLLKVKNKVVKESAESAPNAE